MKVKKFKIRIQTSKETLDEFEKTWKIISAHKGKGPKSDDDIVLWLRFWLVWPIVARTGLFDCARCVGGHAAVEQAVA